VGGTPPPGGGLAKAIMRLLRSCWCGVMVALVCVWRPKFLTADGADGHRFSWTNTPTKTSLSVTTRTSLCENLTLGSPTLQGAGGESDPHWTTAFRPPSSAFCFPRYSFSECQPFSMSAFDLVISAFQMAAFCPSAVNLAEVLPREGRMSFLTIRGSRHHRLYSSRQVG
jgi:hypothetical protein